MGYDWADFERDTKKYIPWNEIWRGIRGMIDAYAEAHGVPLSELREVARKYLDRNPGADEQEVLRHVEEYAESGGSGSGSGSLDLKGLAVPVIAGLVLFTLLRK